MDSYRKTGTGNDCAGQSNVILVLILDLILLDSSPDVNFGLTLPTGSVIIHFHELIQRIKFDLME